MGWLQLNHLGIRKIWNNVPEMSFEVDAWKRSFCMLMKHFRFWSDVFGRCCLFVKNGNSVVWLTSKISPHLPSTFVCNLEARLKKVKSYNWFRCFGSGKSGVFPWFHPKDRQFHNEVCSGRCCDLKRLRETQRVTCKDRVGICKHGNGPWLLERIMRTNLKMISNHILSAVSSIAGWWNISIL